ncbi:MAG: hypothetical protein DRO40_03360 [Thermoprotei archaeon]|nr:MAG: hypothetical protein DRO40_03360 [Thermoprotei archaeon]
MERDLATLGFIIVFIGILIIIIASILMVFSQPIQDSGSRVNVGGCIIIFFIPICFGYGEPWILILTITLTIILVIIVFLLPYIIYKRSIKAYP